MSGRTLTIVLLAWFLFSLIGGISGFFVTTTAPPVALGLAVILPIVLFLFFYVKQGKLYGMLQKLDLRFIVLPQVGRILGLLFIVDYFRGLLPPEFAWPAGLGDFAIGVTAPLIAYLLRSNYAHKREVFVIWNVLGIVDLVDAVTLGILHSQSSFGIFAGDPNTALLSVFPRNLVPTFLVPIFIILHIVALYRSKEIRAVNDRATATSG
jgi:hypothetical protein